MAHLWPLARPAVTSPNLNASLINGVPPLSRSHSVSWLYVKVEFYLVCLSLCVYVSPVLIATQQIVVNVLSHRMREAPVWSLYWICWSNNAIFPNRYHPRRPLGAGEESPVARLRRLHSIFFWRLFVFSFIWCLEIWTTQLKILHLWYVYDE